MPPEPDVEIVTVRTTAQRDAAFAIRLEVFVEEQHVPPELELDDRDRDALHVLVALDGRPAATGRLVTEPAGFEGVDPADGPVAHLGRIAVRAGERGAGLGVAVVHALEEHARDAGLTVAYLSAQVDALAFYERLGYSAHGEVFADAGIDHRHMTRRL